MATLIILLQTVFFVPTFAAPIKDVELLKEPKTLTYKVGDTFKANEISFTCYFTDGTKKEIPSNQLVYYVNDALITNDYKFTHTGNKEIDVCYEDYIYTYNVSVNANPNKKLKEVILSKEPKTFTYKVWDTFKADEVAFTCYFTDGTQQEVVHNQLTFTANEVPISNSYKFTMEGTKKVEVSYEDYVYTYNITVKPNPAKVIKNVELLKEAKTLIYKVGDGFKANEIVLRCYFKDGTFSDFNHTNILFTAGDGAVTLTNGYKFKQEGEKTVKIRFADYTTSFKIKVVAATSKSVEKMEYLTEAKTLTYKVGEGFKANEISIRCYYKDGTYEDLSHDKLTITANGVSIWQGYPFKQAGKKTIVVKVGEFTDTFYITVK